MNPSRGAMKCAARRIRALRIVRRHPSFPLQRPVSLAPRRHRAIALGHNGGDGAAKTLFLARVHPLVPGSSVDDVQTAVEPPLPMPVEVSRNVTVSALSPDGQALRQTTTRTLDGERAATLVKALVEAARARGAAPRDEEDARQALASQLGVHSVATTEIDLRSPWPASVSQVADMEFMHRRQHLEQAYTRQ